MFSFNIVIQVINNFVVLGYKIELPSHAKHISKTLLQSVNNSDFL